MIKGIMAANESVTPNAKELAVLREHFPACFAADGSFDIERFKEYLSDKVAVTNEGYELRFLGKNYARLLASLDTTTVIVPDEAHNSKPENANSQNIYISGDNLDGLKHLLKSYAKKVKCIYIDPPYNTGSDGFVYNDSFSFTVAELSDKLSISEDQAKRILDLTKRGSASHSAWLMFMYPRLLLARDFLSNDGAIFISVDDNECHNLKLLCDDVFGAENFVSSLVWSAGRKNDSRFISNSHEYMLCYFRDMSYMTAENKEWRTRKEGLDDIYRCYDRLVQKYGNDYESIQADLRNWYSSLDDTAAAKRHAHYKCVDSRGIYFASDISWPGGGGPTYEVLHPITGKPCKIPERGWVYPTKERMEEIIAQGLVHFGPDETTVPCSKTYLRENEFEVPYSVFYKDGRAATKRLKSLLSEGVFQNPKDEYILANIFEYATDGDGIVMDFFGGSSSTAHAVFLKNIKAGTKSRFIIVQLPENLDQKYAQASANEKKSVKKAIDFLDSVERPHFLDQIGIERIIRSANKIRTENPETTIDLGFRHFTLAEPSAETLDKLEKFEPESGLYLQNTVLDDFGVPTVLATWLVRDGYGFTAPVQAVDFDGYTGYYMDKHLYLINPNLRNEVIAAITAKYETDGAFNPENVVLCGYSFTWTETESLKVNLARLKDTEKNLRINFDIRY